MEQPPRPPAKSDPIAVIGAGVFGLSTALHLARRGYAAVTVFDRLPYDTAAYSCFDGCDAASADINKIVRSGYGAQTIYQALALESIEGWKQWNAELASGDPALVPDGMSVADRLFINNGELSISETAELPQFERDTVAAMARAGLGHTQLVAGDGQSEETAARTDFGFAMDPFGRRAKGKAYSAVLDTTGGVAVADKACRFAMHKARRLGVRFVLGPLAGALQRLHADAEGQVSGFETRDGQHHRAAMTILACGGWTPTLLPALDGLCETTAGSVAMLKIPPDCQRLWRRFGPDAFPAWAWNMRGGAAGGLYGFPRDENGWLKIGYRGAKYTNPVVQPDGKQRSVPATRWSEGPDQPVGVPKQALDVIQAFLDEYLPELREEGIGISATRLCWYTDSFDNHLVIDRVPATRGLMVATGGSGHAFKYLPALGAYIVDILEGIGLDRPAVKAWRWRALQDGHAPYNVLMEGSSGPRALANVAMSPQPGTI